jgi:pimeloyl-ACP methyl ester carboxylesterase
MAELPSQSGAIGRHFCQVGGQWLHYRRMGQGPAVLLMHQTPQSSQTLEPLMRLLAPHCTAIAVDTPGFGQSEPLPQANWSIALMADRMAQFLDELGIAQVSAGGQHTGAAIAAELARRHPKRVRALALDGLPLFNADEQSSILPHQLYRFVPQVDGTHLIWAWSRFRDGWMFFPWSQRDLAHRRQLDFPEPALIQSWQIMELLRSRESHLCIYPGVFAWDGWAALSEISQPTWVGTPADDQLATHLDRLPPCLPHVQVERLPIGARAQLLQAQTRWLIAHQPAQAAAPEPQDTEPWEQAGASQRRAYIKGLLIQGWQLDHADIPTVLLHSAGGSGTSERSRLGPFAGPLITIDLSGHGDSPGNVLPCEAAAQQAHAALLILGVNRFRLRGRGYGAAVATHWAIHSAQVQVGQPQSLLLEEVLACDPTTRSHWLSAYAQPIVPSLDGSHLIALWHSLRDRELFHPWFERQRANIRSAEPHLDAEGLTQSVFAALQCADWVQAHDHWLRWDPLGPQGMAAVRDAGMPVQVLASASDGWARGLEGWLGGFGKNAEVSSDSHP